MVKDNYIDIHSHIIPGVDDGSQSIEESLLMLDKAYNEGIRTMIATPHYGLENGYAPSKSAVDEGFAQLKAAAADLHPDLRLFQGCELFAAGDIKKRAVGRTMAGTDYLLVEFTEYDANYVSYAEICNTMIGLAADGTYRPILAHANRYRDFAEHAIELRHLVDCGVYLQINAYDLAENPKLRVRQLAQWLVDHELAHFLGTDAHRMERQRPNQKLRPPIMRSGVDYLYDNYEEKYVDNLVRNNAERMLRNEVVALKR